MHSLLDTISASAQVSHRRDRLERVARDRRTLRSLSSAGASGWPVASPSLDGVAARLRRGREPAGRLVALPATASASRPGDQTSPSWSAGRVA